MQSKRKTITLFARIGCLVLSGFFVVRTMASKEVFPENTSGSGTNDSYIDPKTVVLPEFPYQLKDTYQSYKEVMEEKRALKEFGRAWFRDTQKTCGEAYEDVAGYKEAESMFAELKKELMDWEVQFTPTEEEALSIKEEFLIFFDRLRNSTPRDSERPSSIQARACLEAYKNGELSIDDALVQSGATGYIEFCLEWDRQEAYRMLSEHNLLGWYHPSGGDYIAEFTSGYDPTN